MDCSLLRAMKIVRSKKKEGYYTEDIGRTMGTILYPRFLKWINGRKGFVSHRKPVVYLKDVKEFLESL